MRRVIVFPEVSRALGALGLPRKSLLELLDRIHHFLPQNEGRYRPDRDPADPDARFRYAHNLYVAGRWRQFVFSVCDSISPDHLYVEGVVST